MQLYEFYTTAENGFIRIPYEFKKKIGKRIKVTVVNEEQPELLSKTEAQKQNEALKRLSAGLKAIDDEPFDEEFDVIINRRFNIGREIDL